MGALTFSKTIKNDANVQQILPAFPIDMGGFIVKQALPGKQIEQVDPFLLLHHAKTIFDPNASAIHQGVGPHPHRGFSPVTFVIRGAVHHRDSRGNDQVARAGEVQWMNAGSGIIHSERPSEDLVQNGEEQEIIQLWINTPSIKKMESPSYRLISKEEMPLIQSKDQLVINKLVSGSYKKYKSNINIAQSELLLIWGIAQKDGIQYWDLPDHDHTMIYLIKGEISINNGEKTGAENLLILKGKSKSVELRFSEESEYLLLSGAALNEEISQYGPFVMNTRTEILEAMRDYQMGKMGILIENE